MNSERMLITVNVVVSLVAAVQKAEQKEKGKTEKLEKINDKESGSGFIQAIFIFSFRS